MSAETPRRQWFNAKTAPPAWGSAYDPLLTTAVAVLLLLGLLMVASASMHLARDEAGHLHYFWRQALYASLGLGLGALLLQLPTAYWKQLSVGLLGLGALALVLVLIPGVGHEVNGSMRWFRLGFFNLQASEPMKLIMVVYLAGYLVRRGGEVRESLWGALKPLLVLVLITGLLLLEPDYGATVVLFATVLGMLFVGGVPLSRFVLWVAVAGSSLFAVILLAPYRMQRLTTFMDPWADPFNSGFQLTQALIAIGRGEWFGVGLGNSVQKITYLPEAHTDFLFSIIAEELGLLGASLVIGLFALLVARAFAIARRAQRLEQHYAAYLAYGIGLSLGLQALINLGVNMGLLPTKGLTLPFISYGGSSLLMNCLMVALLLRVDHENRTYAEPQLKRS